MTAPAGIDGQVDPLINAVALLTSGAIKADVGDDALVGLYKDPRDVRIVNATQIPGLAVYRNTERTRNDSGNAITYDVQVVFDYVLPSTSLEAREARWPALAAVWKVIVDAMLAGKHPQVEGGADLLEAVEAWVQNKNGLTVRYGTATGGGETYPAMRAEIIVAYTPLPDMADWRLAPWTSFGGTFTQPGDVGDDAQTMIDFDITLEGYSPWPIP